MSFEGGGGGGGGGAGTSALVGGHSTSTSREMNNRSGSCCSSSSSTLSFCDWWKAMGGALWTKRPWRRRGLPHFLSGTSMLSMDSPLLGRL